MSNEPKMSLSLDLDNKWSYMRTYGNDGWKEFPTYLGLVVPRILEFLAARDIRITFFVVGKDASRPENREAIASLAEAGHEIGSHSYMHEPWLHLYSESELDQDLAMAEEAIHSVTGVRVKGFRGPGFSLTETTLRTLHRRGYEYDATAFPNILNPLSRAYLFATTNLSEEEKEQRKALFGSFSDAFRPVKPYEWNLEPEPLFELPVTTMPIFKTPIHFSYLLYLGSFSALAARAYLRFAIAMCKLTGTEPSLLLHPLDFMWKGDDEDVAAFPAMSLQLDKKLELMGRFFDMLQDAFTPLPVGEYVESVRDRPGLRQYEPVFSR